MDIFNNNKVKLLQESLQEAEKKLENYSDLQQKLGLLQQSFGLDKIELDDLAPEFTAAKEEAMHDLSHVSSLYRTPKEIAVLLGSMPDEPVEIYFIESEGILDVNLHCRMTAVFNSKTHKIEYFYGFGKSYCVWKGTPEYFVKYHEKETRLFSVRAVIDVELPKRKYALENMLKKLN